MSRPQEKECGGGDDGGAVVFQDASTGSAGEVHRVGVRVPPFYPQRPGLWFNSLESQFALANITSDITKFHFVIGNLDPVYAVEVEDIINDPTISNKYARLKAELVKRLSASREKKVMQLLTREELGDRTPSQFLRHLKQLAGSEVPESFMRTIWASRLPSSTQAIIASQTKTPLDEVAELADKIHDVVTPNPSIAATSTTPMSFEDPKDRKIAELTSQVNALQMQMERMSRSRTRRRSSSRSHRETSRSQSNYRKFPTCWYHHKFGHKANRCVKPCDFSGNIAGSR